MRWCKSNGDIDAAVLCIARNHQHITSCIASQQDGHRGGGFETKRGTACHWFFT